MLGPVRDSLVADGIHASVHLRTGDPTAEAILDAIQEDEADLLAMTTHGRAGLERTVYGSVAESVLRRARVPVLLKRTSGFGAPEPLDARIPAPAI